MAEREGHRGGPDRARPRTVALIGFMGAGKTSVGQALARRLGWEFVDVDRRVEARTGHSVAEIFATAGEQAFRYAETDALRDALAGAATPRVLALGGGALITPENRQMLQRASVTTVFLEAPLEIMRERCCKDPRKRPLFGDEESFARLYESRKHLYEGAHLRVSTENRAADEVAQEIETRLELSPMRPGMPGREAT
jgi:shikimate kinase